MANNFYFILLIFVFIFGCTSTVRDDNNNLLSDIKIKSNYSDFTVRLPKGWFNSKDNTNFNSDILLINKDFSSSVTVNPFNFKDTSGLSDYDKTRSAINNYLFINKILYKNRKYNDPIITEKNNSFIGILEYTDERKMISKLSVVLKNNKFFEVESHQIKKNFKVEDLEKIHLSVASSISL